MAKRPMMRKYTPLRAAQLRWTCPPSALPFKSTREVKPLMRIVGQQRAMDAIRLGAQIRSQGYNIYVSGMVGTGRLTTVQTILDEHKSDPKEFFDFAYVHNFKQTEMPVLIRFQKGEGRVFARMIDDALAYLKRRIPQLFEEDQFQSDRKSIIQKYQLQEKGLLNEFDSKLRPRGFAVGQMQDDEGNVRTEIFPVIDGKPFAVEQLDELIQAGTMTMERAAEIREEYAAHKEELVEIGRKSMRLIAEFRKSLTEFDQMSVALIVNAAFESVRTSFTRDRVVEYLNGVQKHLLEHLDELVRLFAARQTGAPDAAVDEAIKAFFAQYGVNLVLDNYDTKVAPVIIETSPTYASLFGSIEKRYDARGFYISDFTHIKPGAILRADGGYVIMNALDVLGDPQIWSALKKVMLYNRLEIQNTDSQFQLNALKPEWIKVNVKIILLGDPSIYHYLWGSDEDFHKMFKVHAEFDHQTERTQEMIRNYTAFFAQLAVEDGLLHCDRSGAAALIEWAVERTESQDKITLQFSYVADLLREASFYAHKANALVISRSHVQMAVDQRHWRSNSADESIREQIRKGTLLMDVKGARVGQINGLTVYSTGIVSFGKPARITATVSAGSTGIINIEREVELSGAIHSKGVLILAGLLRSLFSRSQPISFAASIAFEQSYGGIDGDSASAAETVALLSAISNLPIRQDLAITGSINQKGDIQPIGGVNEKITGFFEVCRDRGLTGKQGVLIPAQNVKDLMLRQEIIDAVQHKKFFIYPIKVLEDAVELLLDVPVGTPDKRGHFPPETVYCKVQHNLNVLHEASRMHGKN